MAVDLSTLEHQEQRYRDRLIDDPCNLDARLDLAWCLFLRAVCTVVQDDAPKFSYDSSLPIARHTEERRREEARILLLNGLRETVKVCRLSTDPAHHVDAARLEFLVGLIGEQEIIALAQGQVDASLKRLLSEAAGDSPKRRVRPELPANTALSTSSGASAVRRPGRRAANHARPSNPGA